MYGESTGRLLCQEFQRAAGGAAHWARQGAATWVAKWAAQWVAECAAQWVAKWFSAQ